MVLCVVIPGKASVEEVPKAISEATEKPKMDAVEPVPGA